MVRIAHISDTHIRNLKFHKQYRAAFEDMYSQLKNLKPDYIIHCGDIAHRKTDISPELVEMTTDFLRNLGAIAPTHVILGNHDGNLRNDNRQDAITPIVEAMEDPNIFLHKFSTEVKLNKKITLNVLSVFDKDNWIVEPTDNKKINIALYHGSVSGCKTETGFMLEHGIDISILSEFDFAMLGDIHKTDQKLDHEGRVRYCGSTIQQNHGETDDKGFLIWDIKDRDTFEVKHHQILNINPFVTVILTPKGKVPKNLELPEGARVRLRSLNQISVDAMRKAQSIVNTKFKPESITTQNNVNGVVGSVDDAIREAQEEDLRDPVVQEKLIREYLKDFDLSEETLQEVLNINHRMNSQLGDTEDVSRNLHWRLKDLEWDNLFNYGVDNKVNFDKLSGVVGIFGENYSGKSSTIDSLCYALFNNTSKSVRKSYDIINQNKQKCRAKATIELSGQEYIIERKSEKYVKRLKGEVSNEAKTDVNFTVVDGTGQTHELNGTTRMETDRNIAKYFGTMDDFLLTSMSSQTDSLTFIKEGSTKRKEILAKFLDLLLFEGKYRLANSEASELKGLVRALEGRDYDNEIASAAADLVRSENSLKEHKEKCNTLQEEISLVKGEISLIEEQVDSIPAEIIDAEKTKKLLNNLKADKKNLEETLKTTEESSKTEAQLLEKINEFLSSFDLEEYKKRKEDISSLESQIIKLSSEENSASEKLKVATNKASLLTEVPCGDKFLHCKLLKDATSAQGRLPVLQDNLYNITSRREQKNKELHLLNPELTNSRIDKYEQLLQKKREKERVISESKLLVDKFALEISSKERHIDDLNEDLEAYEKNKDAIENLEALLKDKAIKEKRIKELDKGVDSCEEQMMELYKTYGSLEEKLTSLEESRELMHEKREEFAAYDYFLQCMHSHGISSDIVKKRLPVINSEITKVLSNVVDFEVYLETDGRKLDVFIKHPKFDPRPIELGSGAEKTLAAIAIRLALLSVSTLPRGDVFILDEPGTALDENNMEGFSRIVDLIKTQFNKVILISHLDSLKDAADVTIDIDKKDGFAHINQ
jgi:DNA repair exonuclease SbcCD ATPase subunit/DNA repair exonuclease SbcCD nuclease subunit